MKRNLKESLRRNYIQTIKEIPNKQIQSVSIFINLISLDLFEDLTLVASYENFKDEVSTKVLNGYFIDHEIELLLPTKTLENPQFEKSSGAISTGNSSKNPQIIIVPGIAFDHEGNRLGRGSGWYDRILINNKTSTKIGLAFNEQIHKTSLPIEIHDVKMDLIVTSNEIIYSE